jgi:hypothetical protein
VIEAAVVARLPDLELRLFLEDADEDRRLRVHALPGEQSQRLFAERLLGGRQRRRRARARRDDARSE